MPIRTAQLLQTKLQRPGVTRNLVPRPRLIERLNQAVSGPLTLVCAPAGFGKTTLVSSWIEGIAANGGTGEVTPPLPSAWLSLDEDDSDLVLFLRYFIAALRTITPGVCAQTAGMLEAPRQPPVDMLFATLSNEIALLPGRFILVLDDYYTIHGEAVHDFLNALVRHWPQPMHMVLISRLNPSLPLASLRAQGRLVEIRTRDLRFTRDEAAAYLSRALLAPLSEPALALLEQRAEGWIAGLCLATLSLRATDDAEAVLATLSGADTDIADYLVDEVLSHQPTAIQAFLLRTSILDHFCASLCETVAGSRDPECNARACMDWVERANLFVIPLDNRGEWYRYHPLFQDLLQQRLLAEAGPDELKELHRRAAGWFAGHGLIDEALRHAMTANDLDLAARLMEQGLCDVLNREDRPTLERWLHLLPEEFIQRRPQLLLIKAWALHLSWQLGAVSKVLREVEALIGEKDGAAVGPEDLRSLRGQIVVLHGQQAYQSNQPVRCIACCQEASALLPESWRYVRGAAMLYLGVSMQASGQGDAAERLLLDHYEAQREKADGYALRLLFALCYNAVQAGRLEQARATAQTMLQQATRSGLAILMGWAHYYLGLVHYQWNDLEVAAQHFGEIVNKRYVAHALTVRHGATGLALVQQARGEGAAAWHTLELLSQSERDSTGLESDETRSLRARLLLLKGDVESAFRWADAYTVPVPDRPLAWLINPHLTRACILLARGTEADVQSALHVLDALNEIAKRTYDTRYMIEILALRALALDAAGQAGDAQIALQHAVDLSRPGGFIRTFVDLGSRIRDMLIRLAAQGIAVETVRRILAAFPVSPSGTEPGEAQLAIVNRKSEIVESLTMREYDVLILLRERLSNKEIAGKLHLSTATVKRHLVNIYGKLGVNKRLEAVIKAETLGIVPRR